MYFIKILHTTMYVSINIVNLKSVDHNFLTNLLPKPQTIGKNIYNKTREIKFTGFFIYQKAWFAQLKAMSYWPTSKTSYFEFDPKKSIFSSEKTVGNV